MIKALLCFVMLISLSISLWAGEIIGDGKSDGKQQPTDVDAISGKIFVKNVSGQFTADTGTFTFQIALTVESIDPSFGTKLSGFTNAFVVNSSDGATWENVTAAVSPALLEGWGGSIISTVWSDNITPDSVGYNTTGQPKKFLDTGTYDGAFQISMLLHASDIGKTICLDSLTIPPLYVWNWKTSGSVGSIRPVWGGKYCFTIPQRAACTITASAGSDGTISPSGAVLVAYGTDQLFTFTPDAGHKVFEVVVDGIPLGSLPSYTFTDVTTNHKIMAIFSDTLFAPTQQYQADIEYMNSSDLDQDNFTDIVYSSSANASPDLGGLWTAFGLHGGTFDTPVKLLGARSTPMVIDFFNSDTMPDIAAVGSVDGQYVYVLLNNGNRTFSVDSVPYSGSPVTSIASGHFNQDQYADIVLGNGTIIYGGPGSPRVAQQPSLFTADGLNVADFNSDGFDDLAVRQGDSITIYLSDQVGGFVRKGSMFVGFSVGPVPPTASVADIDRDGHPDIAAATYIGVDSVAHSVVTVGFGDGAGGFRGTFTAPIVGEAVSAVIADVDRDYNLDVVVSSGSSLDEKVVVLYGDGQGNFPRQSETLYPHPAGNTVAMTSGDLDRDGNPDFVTGAYQGPGPITIMYSTPPDAPVLSDEMVVTGYSGVHSLTGFQRAPQSGSSVVSLQVTNPEDYTISDDGSTVAGSFYWKLDADQNGILDQRTVDYNLVEGEYRIVAVVEPNSTNPTYSIGVAIDGSQQATVALNSTELGGGGSTASPRSSDSAVYYFRVEKIPAISPQSGIATSNSQPVIDWSGLVKPVPGSITYDFQLSQFTDFRTLMEDVQGLTESHYFLKNALDRNAVYYWRVREVIDGQPGPWWHDYALYIASGCCSGITGNVDCDPENRVDIGDLTVLIDHLFVNFNPLCCEDEANIDGVGGVDASDLAWLITYLYWPVSVPPAMCKQ